VQTPTEFTPEQVYRLRELLGLSQREAARRFGVTLNTWSRWEIGAMRVHRARVPQLLDALRVLETREQRAMLDAEEQRQNYLSGLSETAVREHYRSVLDDVAARLHELTLPATYLSTDEFQQQLGDLTTLIIQQLRLLYLLKEKAKHRTGYERTMAAYYADSDNKLRARHRDQINRFREYVGNGVPATDRIWRVIESTNAILNRNDDKFT